MYASVGKCIITFSKSLETFLTTYRTKRRSSSKISDFLSKVTSFLHLFLIKSTNIYNNRQTLVRKFWNFTQHLRLHPLASKKVSHDFKQLVLHVPHRDGHLLVTHNDMCETCMLQWGSASSLSQNHLKLFWQHTVPKGGAPAKFRIF
jgi:hypothetical protein